MHINCLITNEYFIFSSKREGEKIWHERISYYKVEDIFSHIQKKVDNNQNVDSVESISILSTPDRDIPVKTQNIIKETYFPHTKLYFFEWQILLASYYNFSQKQGVILFNENLYQINKKTVVQSIKIESSRFFSIDYNRILDQLEESPKYRPEYAIFINKSPGKSINISLRNYFLIEVFYNYDLFSLLSEEALKKQIVQNQINPVLEQNTSKLSSEQELIKKLDQLERKTVFQLEEIKKGIDQQLKNTVYTQRENKPTQERTDNPDQQRLMLQLNDENNKYRDDLFYKMMRTHCLDYLVEVANQLRTTLITVQNEKYKNNPEHLMKVLESYPKYIDNMLRKLNVKTEHSSEGSLFDPLIMEADIKGIETSNPSLKGRVARSISPAYYWTIPLVNRESQTTILYREEKVQLYE